MTVKQNKLLKLTHVVYLDWVIITELISRANTLSLHLHSLFSGSLPHYSHDLLSATCANFG